MTEYQQLSLEAALSPEQQKQAGIDAAAARAGETWTAYAFLKLQELCETHEYVWGKLLRDFCEWHPGGGQAWARPWQKAHKAGWLERTARTEPDPEAKNHACTVFKSRIYGQKARAA